MSSLDCLQYRKQCINSYYNILFRNNDEKCLHILTACIFLVFIKLLIYQSPKLQNWNLWKHRCHWECHYFKENNSCSDI